MAVLSLHHEAVSDLAAIRLTEPRHAALIQAALQEIEADPDLSANLLDHGFGLDANHRPCGLYGVKKWTRLWDAGRDIWRLRAWKLEGRNLNYRIVYAYLVQQRQFCVLAITPKAPFDYDDPNDPIAQRVSNAFDSL